MLRVYSMYVNNFERAHRTIAEYLKKDAYIAFLDSHGFTSDHLESLYVTFECATDKCQIDHAGAENSKICAALRRSS